MNTTTTTPDFGNGLNLLLASSAVFLKYLNKPWVGFHNIVQMISCAKQKCYTWETLNCTLANGADRMFHHWSFYRTLLFKNIMY